VAEVNVQGRHILGNAVVDMRAEVSEDAVVTGNAHVTGGARIFGKAIVCGNAVICDGAEIFGEVCIMTGVFDLDARIGCNDDFVQQWHEGVVWTRFRTESGYRTTCTQERVLLTSHIEDMFDRWQEARHD
jgi:NDP-sugar pyrophosphorylase family protein